MPLSAKFDVQLFVTVLCVFLFSKVISKATQRPLRCLCALKGRSPLYPPKGSRAAKTKGKKMQSETRNRSIKIRLTDDEFETLNRKKTRPELARWMREIALENEQKTRKKNFKKK